MKKLQCKPEDRLLSRRYRDRVLRLANEYVEKEVKNRQEQSNTVGAFLLLCSFLFGMIFMAALARIVI